MSRAAAARPVTDRAGASAAVGVGPNESSSPQPSFSCPRHEFDCCARAVLSTTLIAAVLVAVAPALPAAARSHVVFGGLVAWTVAVVWGTVAAARLAVHPLRRDFASAATALAVGGLGVTVLAATHLEIIRVLYHRPALTWNIDWRFHLNVAQAIARYGGIDRALDYAGAPVDYHVGPAWFAGATGRVLGHGIFVVSFGLVPLLCTISTAIALLYALHVHGLSYRLAAAAAVMSMTLPGLSASPRDLYYVVTARDLDVLTNVWTYWSMMPNSSLGVTVGLATLALLLDRRSRGWQVAFASAGLASLVELKPQFFVGVGLLVGLIGIEQLLRRPNGSQRTRVLAGAVAALVLGLTSTAVLPVSTYASVFAAPVWAPGRTGYALTEPFTNACLLFLLAVALWSAVDASTGQRRFIGIATATYIATAAFPSLGAARVPVLLAVAGLSLVIARTRTMASETVLGYRLPMRVAAAMSILVAAFYLISFPVRADVVAQAQLLVEPTFSDHGAQRDLAQALVPLQLLLVASAVGLLAAWAARRDAWLRRGFCTAAALSVASLAALVSFHFARPQRGHEAAEDLGLLQTLQAVPRDSQLLIASDLADPAEDYRRPLRAFLLTGYTGHAFYVANLRYVHFTRPDAAKRGAELRAFFGSPWSPWHEAWLHSKGVGYVLISDRCPPVWLNQPGVPLRLLAHYGHWTGYAARSAASGAPARMPVAHDLTPRFGAQGCLSFKAKAT